ncbi:MAG: VanW family protein [Lachnospiraceae bacterium]|nr:VanW family protein [Lachnospiraceae bacterium]
MKKFVLKGSMFFCMALLLWFVPVIEGQAKDSETMKPGVYAGDISLEGMTRAEAEKAIGTYIASLEPVEIILLTSDNQQVVTTAGELGISWANPEILDEALRLGTRGNIVQRYKALKDLEYENKVYPIELDFDITAINLILTEQCTQYDREAVDAGLTRENGVFVVEPGQIGYLLDVEASIDTIYEYLTGDWNGETCSITLNIEISEPRGSEEELLQVKDVLGTFTTSYSTSNGNRSANVANGCRLIDGTLLYPGDEFSCYEAVSPFTERNGYYMAGSYLNGKVVDSLGGGICQVSTTLYNAVLLSELEVTERNNHSMIVTYVDPSKDAAIAESSGKDFRFVNNTGYPIYIEGRTTSDKKITFTIYGVETRPEGHTVEYVSEVLETINPTTETIYTDAGQPIGVVNVTSAHIGYKAQLWKVVKENGVEVSREVINTSSYKMVPRSAVVGIATADPNAYNALMEAIATNDINHVRNVASMLAAQANAAAAEQAAAEQPPAPAQ